MRKMNAVVMTIAGSLLIAAGVLKSHEVLTVYFPSWRAHGLWESWEFFLVQIPLELALGIWMVSGLFRKAAWVGGTAAYILFIFVTLHKGLTGAESCGCFGHVQVDPWVTLFAIDLPFALLLLMFRPRGLKLLPPPWPKTSHALATAVPIFAVLIFMTPMLVALRPEFIQAEDWSPQTPIQRPPAKVPPVEDPEIQTHLQPAPEPEPEPKPQAQALPAGEPEVQDPPAKVPEVQSHPQPAPEPEREPEPQAQALPLWPWLEHIDIADQLKDGLVIAYMYHHACGMCAEGIPSYEAFHQEMSEQGVQVAFLAIPPYGPAETGPVAQDTDALHGKLTDQRSWTVTSPFVVAILEGAVVKQWPQGTAPEPGNILEEIFAH